MRADFEKQCMLYSIVNLNKHVNFESFYHAPGVLRSGNCLGSFFLGTM